MTAIDKYYDAENALGWGDGQLGKYIISYRFPSEGIEVHFLRRENEINITETSAHIIPISIVQRMTTLAIREFEADEMSFYDLQNCKFIRYKCRY